MRGRGEMNSSNLSLTLGALSRNRRHRHHDNMFSTTYHVLYGMTRRLDSCLSRRETWTGEKQNTLSYKQDKRG